MSKELKDKLLKEFPGKMENEQAFIMQFIMKEAQQGRKPPSKDDIDESIKKMVKKGIFEKKGPLLILRASKPLVTISEEEEEEEEETPIVSPNLITGNFTESQKIILNAFQGKYENRSAIIMNVTMTELSKGKRPPERGVLEKSIEELIEKGALELKGDLLIKKL
ncbi:MAG: hypothetical protein ACFFB5_06310 [Promethearchaeota archaeon]